MGLRNTALQKSFDSCKVWLSIKAAFPTVPLHMVHVLEVPLKVTGDDAMASFFWIRMLDMTKAHQEESRAAWKIFFWALEKCVLEFSLLRWASSSCLSHCIYATVYHLKYYQWCTYHCSINIGLRHFTHSLFFVSSSVYILEWKCVLWKRGNLGLAGSIRMKGRWGKLSIKHKLVLEAAFLVILGSRC